MINIAIVDDNQFYVEDIKRLLSQNIENTEYEIYEYFKVDDFKEQLDYVRFDIIFLDIILDKSDGIETGLLINDRQPSANIIFISAYPEYFKEVYKVEHSYFLIKDFEKERFSDAILKALKAVRKDVIIIDTKKDKYNILLKDVIYFEGYLKHTKVFMTNGEVIECSVNIKNIEKSLPKDIFIRTHQSFIVNMNHIKKYNRKSIFMNYDKEIPVSRTYVNTVREKITFFLGGAI